MKNSEPDQALVSLDRNSHRLFYRFDNVEEAQAHLSGNYSLVKIESESDTSFDLMCAAAILENVAFTSNSSKSGFRIGFGSPFDGYGMSLPTSGAMSVTTIDGRLIDALGNGGLVVDSLEIESARFSPQSVWRRIMMPSNELHRHIALLTEQPVTKRVSFSNHFDRDSVASQSIFTIDQVIAMGMRGDAPLLKAPAALASLKDAVLSMFVEGLPNSYSTLLAGPALLPAPRNVKRAIEFMQANLLQPLSLADIANAAGTSARSLQIGFRQFRDMTPMEYLRRLRLNGAHQDLIDALPGTAVATIAYRWGFAHHGMFAASYAKVFGEPPSATLKKSRSRR